MDNGEAYLIVEAPARPSCIYPYVRWEDGVHYAIDPHDDRVFGIAHECWQAYVTACLGMGLFPDPDLLELECYCQH